MNDEIRPVVVDLTRSDIADIQSGGITITVSDAELGEFELLLALEEDD